MDPKLQDIINRMVDAGESDENIKLRVDAYKEEQAKSVPKSTGLFGWLGTPQSGTQLTPNPPVNSQGQPVPSAPYDHEASRFFGRLKDNALGMVPGLWDIASNAVSTAANGHPIDAALDAGKRLFVDPLTQFGNEVHQGQIPEALADATTAIGAPEATRAVLRVAKGAPAGARATAGFVADSPKAQSALAHTIPTVLGFKTGGPLGALVGFGQGELLKPIIGDVAARASLTASDYLKAGFNPDEVSLMRADGMSKGDIASAVRAELKRQKSVGQRQAILDQLGADDGPAKAHVTDLNAQAKAASAHHIDVSDLFKDDGGPSYVGDLKDFSVVDDGAPYEHAIDDAKRAVENNGSGESAASQEALSRARGMKSRGESYAVFDRSGNMRPLIGPDAVDYVPKKGETYGIQTPDGFRTLTDNGGKVGNAALSPQLSSLNLQWGQDLATNQRLGVPDEYTITEDPEGADMMEHISKAQRQAINDRMKQLAKDAAAAKKPLLKPVWKDGKLQLP